MAKKTKSQVAKAMDCTPHRYAPRITFTDKDIKGLKDMEIGKEHSFTITGKLVSLSKDEYGFSENKDLSGTFKIIKADNKTLDYDGDERLMPVKKVDDKWEVNGVEYDTEAKADAAYQAIVALKFDVPKDDKKSKKVKAKTKKKSKKNKDDGDHEFRD